MNTNDISQTSYSVRAITQRRLQKRAELRASKEKIVTLTQDLFNPPTSKNKMDAMMHHVNAGIAAYDGLMTGIRIFRRIREYFGSSRRRK